jgi:hypothetical protein
VVRRAHHALSGVEGRRVAPFRSPSESTSRTFVWPAPNCRTAKALAHARNRDFELCATLEG